MLVLVWDQEKIVLLNLVLFCYFIKYMAGSSIHSSLSQRGQILEEALLADITYTLSNVKALRTEYLKASKDLHFVLLALLSKFTLNSISLGSRFNPSPTAVDFSDVQIMLQAAHHEVSSRLAQSTLLLTKEVLADVSPTLDSDAQAPSEE